MNRIDKVEIADGFYFLSQMVYSTSSTLDFELCLSGSIFMKIFSIGRKTSESEEEKKRTLRVYLRPYK